MNKITQQISEMETYLSDHAKVNLKISQASVGWQIEHSLLTINKITYVLENSNPDEFIWSFKLPRLIVFTLHKMPRGKAKAPSAVQPTNVISLDTISSKLATARIQVQKLEILPANKFFKHPFFGDLKLKQAIKMLEIHTGHHLNIIRDIVK